MPCMGLGVRGRSINLLSEPRVHCVSPSEFCNSHIEVGRMARCVLTASHLLSQAQAKVSGTQGRDPQRDHPLLSPLPLRTHTLAEKTTPCTSRTPVSGPSASWPPWCPTDRFLNFFTHSAKLSGAFRDLTCPGTSCLLSEHLARPSTGACPGRTCSPGGHVSPARVGVQPPTCDPAPAAACRRASTSRRPSERPPALLTTSAPLL